MIVSRHYWLLPDLERSAESESEAESLGSETDNGYKWRLWRYLADHKQKDRRDWHWYLDHDSGRCWSNIPPTFNSSSTDCAGSKRSRFTELFPIQPASIELNGVRIDGQSYPFLCVVLAQRRALDVEYRVKKALVDFLFHRMEKACSDFIQRVLPRKHQLMFLEAHDEIDLEDWARFLSDMKYEWPEGSVVDNDYQSHVDFQSYCTLANELRNAAMHSRDLDFGMLYNTVAWAARLKEDSCLTDVQEVLKGLFAYQCRVEGVENPIWEVTDQEQAAFERTMLLTWVPCLTTHQFTNMTVRSLQKACFVFWQKNKTPDDPNSWTTAEDVELQQWYYDHGRLLTRLAPVAKQVQLYDLLESAKTLRNYNAHREQLSLARISWVKSVAIELLEILGDNGAVLNILLAERLLYTNLKSSEDRVLKSFGSEVDWVEKAKAARLLSQSYEDGYYQSSTDKNLQRMFLRAHYRFRDQSILGYGAIYEILDQPLRGIGWTIDDQSREWYLNWREEIKASKAVDQSEDNDSESDPAINSDTSYADSSPSYTSLTAWFQRVVRTLSRTKKSSSDTSDASMDDCESPSDISDASMDDCDWQSDDTYYEREEIDEDSSNDLKAWIASETWIRPYAPPSATTEGNTVYDPWADEAQTVDGNPTQYLWDNSNEYSWGDPNELTCQSEGEFPVDEAAVELREVGEAVPFAWRSSLVNKIKPTIIEDAEDVEEAESGLSAFRNVLSTQLIGRTFGSAWRGFCLQKMDNLWRDFS